MLYGSIVNTDDYSKIRIFCPDLIYVDFLPSYGDNYIIDVKNLSADKFRQRFSHSILMSPFGIDFSNKEKIFELVEKERSLSQAAKNNFISLEGDEFWNAIRIYLICGKYKVIEDESSLYPFLKVMGGSQAEIIREISEVSSTPIPVMFSTVLTFLLKMKTMDSLQLNPKYKFDLIEAKKRLKQIKLPLINYLKSDEDMSDFIFFMLSI